MQNLYHDVMLRDAGDIDDYRDCYIQHLRDDIPDISDAEIRQIDLQARQSGIESIDAAITNLITIYYDNKIGRALLDKGIDTCRQKLVYLLSAGYPDPYTEADAIIRKYRDVYL